MHWLNDTYPKKIDFILHILGRIPLDAWHICDKTYETLLMHDIYNVHIEMVNNKLIYLCIQLHVLILVRTSNTNEFWTSLLRASIKLYIELHYTMCKESNHRRVGYVEA